MEVMSEELQGSHSVQNYIQISSEAAPFRFRQVK